jgi:hypothetical protein
MCRSLVYYLEGGGPLGGLCVAAARLRRRHRRKIYFGCAGGRHLFGKAVQPGQGLLQPGTAIWSSGVGAGWSGGEAAIRSGIVGTGWSGGEAAIRSGGVGSNWSRGVGSDWSHGVGGSQRSGHGVCNYVLLARDVPDVAGVFRYVGQVAALPRRPGVCSSGQGESDGLVVS